MSASRASSAFASAGASGRGTGRRRRPAERQRPLHAAPAGRPTARPKKPLIRSISSGARCCSSSAARRDPQFQHAVAAERLGPGQAAANSAPTTAAPFRLQADEHAAAACALMIGNGEPRAAAPTARESRRGARPAGRVGYCRRAAPISRPCRAFCPIRQPRRHRARRRSRSAARLVRPPPPRPAVARAGRAAARPLPRVAQRDHAAADHGRDCRPLFRPIRGALARCSRARRGLARRGAAPVAGARLLRPRPQPARLRPRRRRAARRRVPARSRRRCAPCPGSATTPRRRSPRSPSTSRTRRSTAMSSGSSRGFSPMRDAAAGRKAAPARARRIAGAASSGPAISPRR